MLRLPLLGLAGAARLAGLWAWAGAPGLGCAAWAPGLDRQPRPLMISSFLGTLISLERALALAVFARSRWPYRAPGLSALGALALGLGLPAVPQPLPQVVTLVLPRWSPAR